MKKLTTALIILNLVVGTATYKGYNYLREKEIYEANTFKLVQLEKRAARLSSNIWILKTKVEFPNFPPKVGIKAYPFRKISMKYKTKK